MVRANLFISFVDMMGYTVMARATPDPLQLFELLNDLAKITVRHVESSSGKVVKFIGDDSLLIYPEEMADACVLSIRALIEECERHLRRTGHDNVLRATVHFGEAAIGPFGPASHEATDVIGESVNIAATLGQGLHAGGLILSPPAFERLSPPVKKLFRRNESPEVFISVAGT